MKTQKNSVRRSLILSATALMISVAMLIGTTFAWFTDSVSSGKNPITAGNLDIIVSYVMQKDSMEWHKMNDITNIFIRPEGDVSGNDWEPGYTKVAFLRVENDGTLAATYQAVVKVANATPFTNKNGEKTTLDKYLKYGVSYYSDETEFNNYRKNLTRDEAVKKATTPLASFAGEKQTLGVGEMQYIMLVVTMPTDVGNEANAASKNEKGSIDLTVQINGTQDDVEKDSFGQLYDSRAYDDIETEVGTTDVTPGEEGDTKTVTMAVGVEGEKGYTTATMTGTDADIAAEGKTAEDLRLVVHKESKPTTEAKDGYTYEPLNITVENKAADALVTISRYIGANKRGVKVYRGGSAMISESSAEGLAGDHYSYNKDTGIVTFATNTFDIGSTYTGSPIDCSKYDIAWTDKVTSTDELEDAIAAGETNIELTTGRFELPNLKDKTVTISGDGGNTTILMQNKTKEGDSITFNNVAIKFGDTDKEGFSGFISTKELTYINCRIYGKQKLFADKVTFKECKFIQDFVKSSESAEVEPDYNVWIYSAKNTTFEGCTFDCEGKAVLVDNDGIPHNPNNVEFTNCTFTGTTPIEGIAAIEIDSSKVPENSSVKITIDAFTANNVEKFSVGTNSESTVWNNKAGTRATVIVDNQTVLDVGQTKPTTSSES